MSQPGRHRRVLLLGVFGLSCLVGACAETTGGPSGSGSGRSGGEGGSYKIGKPYQIGGRWYYPREDYDYNEVGEASWYGPDFHGKRTANGEIFDQDRLTAAHTVLPMPSVVQVTNLANGRSVVLRVNDRGPFANDRIIDVSRGAARALGFERNGRTQVRVKVMAEESRLAKAEALGGASTLVAEAPPPVAVPRAAVETVSLDLPPPPRRVEAAPLDTPRPPPVASARASSSPLPGSSSRPSGNEAGAGGGRVAVPSSPARAGWVTGPAAQNTTAAAARDASSRDVPARAASAGASSDATYVQVGAFSNVDNANALRNRIKNIGPAMVAPVHFGDHVLYRVRLGPFSDAETASQILRNAQSSGYPEARIVAD